MPAIRIATRGSDLALAQARFVAGLIGRALSVETELVVVQTTGDRIQNVSLAKIGGKGLFIKEIEEALLDGRADVAIHSAKDLPAVLADGLVLAGFPDRADPRDALVARDPDATIESLPRGARIGTGSTRRTALLRAIRPDLDIVPLRGNVPTRIAKIETDGLAGVILASAGLDRLKLSSKISERITPDMLLPAVCQGTLALESRAGESLADDLAQLGTPAITASVAAERGLLCGLEGDCTTPLAAFAEIADDGMLRMRGLVASSDGARIVRGEIAGRSEDAAALGRKLAEELLARGAREILEALRAEAAATGEGVGGGA